MDVRSTDSDEGLTTQGAFGHHIHATGERDFLVAQELLRSSRRGILSFHEESKRTTLYDFISAQRAANVPYNPRRYFSYARQITRAVGFLHKEKIYSVTPCPHTIFLDNENSSIILAENDKIPVNELAEWKSPEELVFGQKFPIKSDIFSLGTTFHHLWTYGQHPFGGNSHQRVATIQRGDDPEFGQMFIENEEIAQSMSRIMLTHDPTLRPTTMDVLYELMILFNGSPESIARLGDTLASIEKETQTISKERDPDKLERARQKLESVTKQGLYQGHFGTSLVALPRRPEMRRLGYLIEGPDEILAQSWPRTKQTDWPTQTFNAKQEILKQHYHDHLRVIDLSGVAVTLEDIEAIASVIDYAFELEKIDLSFCHLKAGLISHLKNAITTKPKVHNLLVHGNPHLALEDLVDGVKFVAEGKVEAQFQYDEAYLPDEEKWKLKDFAGIFQETDGARRRGAVEVTGHSKTIDFNQQKVSNEVIRYIASTMNFSTRLDEINLTSCHLRPGAICLLNALVISNSKLVGRFNSPYSTSKNLT